ncbi:MAG: hypothetical protein MJZ87_07660 [Bacteroidales bacterium]|nr:hypothetical protein [Bacteroidales bacterium]
MKIKLILSFCIASITLAGCLKEGSETIALPFGRVPDTVIPDEIRDQLEQHLPIYEGITPPNISGKYLVQPDQLVYSSDGQFSVGHVFAPLYLSFENQTASGMATYTERNGSSTAESSEVYVVGTGNNFTAYFMTHSTTYDDDGNIEATCIMSNILSGTITNNGISNYRLAFVMLEKNDPHNTLMDVNEYRVFEDGDGLAVKYNWYKSEKIDDNLPARFIKKSNN